MGSDENPSNIADEGITLFKQRRFKEAAEKLEKAIDLEPEKIGLWNLHAQALANTGDYELPINVDDPALEYNEDFDLAVGSGSCSTPDFEAGDVAGCMRLEVSTPAPITSDFENMVYVTSVLGEPVPNELSGEAGGTCTVETEGPTRTRGFWQTHGSNGTVSTEPGLGNGYTCYVWDRSFADGMDLGWVELESCSEALGAFWANNAKDSFGKRRDKVCQAQVNAC